jgi:hypothetical protein
MVSTSTNTRENIMEKMYVDPILETHLQDALEDLVGDNRIPENYGACVDTHVQTVCHKSYDGFIPHTNGGFDLMLATDLRSAEGSGDYPSNEKVRAELDRVIDDCYKDSLKEFIHNNKELLQPLFPNIDLDEADHDTINYHDLYEMDQGSIAEKLSEYESEWMSEGGTFWYQFRVLYFSADNARNESGEDEMYFMAGINTDFEYGRDSGLELTYEKNIPVDSLTIKGVDAIINDMVDSI